MKSRGKLRVVKGKGLAKGEKAKLQKVFTDGDRFIAELRRRRFPGA